MEIKIHLTTKSQAVKDFSETIAYLYYNRVVSQKMSESCYIRQQELSWDSKAMEMIEIYKKAISQFIR